MTETPPGARGEDGTVIPRHQHVPAWLRPTQGEQRWGAAIVILVAVGLQLALPTDLAIQPHWLLPGLELLLLAVLMVANPGRISEESRLLRMASVLLIGVISVANAFSASSLVLGLVQGRSGTDAPTALLVAGGTIWLTNVIVFALWYWELDRGGPAARAWGRRATPDFGFVQMSNPELSAPEWEPSFVDYLYLSFTNATAFSPTDVMPLSRWAKLLMMLQSAVALLTVLLVIARAVNILK